MISITKRALQLFIPTFRKIHCSPLTCKEDHRRERLKAAKYDEGTSGEKGVNIDNLLQRDKLLFPDANSGKRLFDGIPFDDLPICNLKVSKNNTIISLTNAAGKIHLLRSCGMEGFKNCKKGTNVAAQATAVSIATKAVELGYKTLRVRVRGLGPGRTSGIKGLQMGGLNIISITDSTRVSWNPPRPRKARRL